MPLKIQTRPLAAFTYLAPITGIFDPGTLAMRRESFAGLCSRARAAACSPSEAAQVAVHQDLALDAGPALLRHSEVRKVVESDAFLSLRFLLENYRALAPLLEPVVRRNSEALSHLVLAVEGSGIQGAPPAEAFHEALLRGPFWALRYATSPTSSDEHTAKRAKFTARLRDHAAQFATTSSECALVHLLMNPHLSAKAFTAQLSRDAFVAYVASGTLATRDFSIRLDQVQQFTPRWAVHCALWGLFSEGNHDPRLETVITMDPAWAAEYLAGLENRQSDWSWVESLYHRANDAIARHALPSLSNLLVDLLCATIGRIARAQGGKDPRITFEQFLAEAEEGK